MEPYFPEVVKKKVSDTGIEINKKIESLKSFVFKTVQKTPTEPESSVVKPIQHKIEFKLANHAIKKSAKQFSYEVGNEESDASSFLNRAREGAIKILKENRNKKVYIVLTCEMKCSSILTGESVTRIVPFSSTSRVVLESTDLEKFYNRAKEVILENMIKYNKMGSNCVVSAIVKMDINMIDYNPLRASSFIPLSRFLKTKKAISNIKNEDNECFKWCVTRALMNMESKNQEKVDKNLIKKLKPKKNQERMGKDLIEKSNELNWEGIDFPVSILTGQITKFEKNKEDISVNVYGYKNELYPLRRSKYCSRKHKIDLLLISNEDKSLYCLIKSLSRLASSQSSKSQHKTYYCRNCLLGYNSVEELSKHSIYCN